MGKYRIQVFPAIVVNYATCVITGVVVRGHLPPINTILQEPWLPLALILGTMFIVVFNLIAASANKAGVTITALANKMSLIIPIAFAFMFMGETVTTSKIIGIILALIAMGLATYTNAESSDTPTTKSKYYVYLLPLVVFIGSGTVDTFVNYIRATQLAGIPYEGFLIFLFLTACTLGIIALPFYFFKTKKSIGYKEVLAGILLGLPNYASLHFMLKSLEFSGLESSVVFPLLNIGVVSLSAVIAYFAFQEKLSKLNVAGIILALVAIAILGFDKL